MKGFVFSVEGLGATAFPDLEARPECLGLKRQRSGEPFSFFITLKPIVE